jgi:hypothetical protein
MQSAWLLLSNMPVSTKDTRTILQPDDMIKRLFSADTRILRGKLVYELYINTYRDKSGISKVSPYELCHTFVSVVKQLSKGLLKRLVGYSKDMDTYGVYSHEMAGDMEATFRMVEELFESVLGKSVL